MLCEWCAELTIQYPTKLMVCPFNYLVKYLDKRKKCVGTEPSALLYVGILVTSTTTMAQRLVLLLHKHKVGGVQFLVVARVPPPPPPPPAGRDGPVMQQGISFLWEGSGLRQPSKSSTLSRSSII